MQQTGHSVGRSLGPTTIPIPHRGELGARWKYIPVDRGENTSHQQSYSSLYQEFLPDKQRFVLPNIEIYHNLCFGHWNFRLKLTFNFKLSALLRAQTPPDERTTSLQGCYSILAPDENIHA